jgi:hypothetical protein
LAVACAVFGLVAVFIFRLLRRKGRDHSMYNMAASGKCTGSVTTQHLFRPCIVMRYLHHVHGSNARAGHVCLSVSMIQLENR